MSLTEDRLRDAFDAAAQTVRPDSLTQLTVPSARRRLPRWVLPMVAAAAVVVVALVSVSVARQIGQRDNDVAGARTGAPPYVVAIRGGDAHVEDATNGRGVSLLSTGGEYTAVASTGDRRTFFLAGREAGRVDLYRFVIDREGVAGPARPILRKPLRLDLVSPGGLAASPDGSKLALVGIDRIVVVNTRTGEQRTWLGKGQGYFRSATWSPDGRTLGFISGEEAAESGQANLRLLDTARAKGDDVRAARVLRGVRIGTGEINVFVFNPDGQTLTAQTQGDKTGPDDHADYRLTELTATTGQPTGDSVKLPGDSFFVKVDDSGQHILQIVYGRLGRVDDGRFSWISDRLRYEDAAW